METELVHFFQKKLPFSEINKTTGKPEMVERNRQCCVAATKAGVGYAICNPVDNGKFTKQRARQIAVGRANNPTRPSLKKSVTIQLSEEMERMMDRRKKYFKVD